jgi:hypothetical protein
MTTQSERRTQSRKRPASLVYVELPPANGGMMRDLSEYGFSLRAMMPLQAAEKVAFSFILDSTARIDGDAIVVRLEDNGHVAALEFAGLSAHARDQIRQWLDKYDETTARETAKPIAAPAANSTFEELRSEIRSTEVRPSAPRVQLPAAKPAAAEPPPTPESPQAGPPPLLKLSSVRPAPPLKAPEVAALPPAKEKTVEPALPEEATTSPQPKLLETTAAAVEEAPVVPPTPAESESASAAVPALEPLSALEGEADAANLSWMENFTLTRAIGIMLVITLVAGSIVYHRELGHALMWLGQKIAGEESSETRHPSVPPISTAGAPATPEDAAKPNVEAASPAPAVRSADTASSAAKSAELPAASQATPAPQLKDSASPSIVPLNQVTRPPVASGSSPPAGDTGQQDYLHAQAILHAPGRGAELSEAVRLLWAAVEKGNVGAEITLADLYRAGRGVARNCAQAKILLSTAARKGSPDAQKRLEALQREGCEE